VLKVARTVSDLAGDERVMADHVAEALQYRLVEHGSGCGIQGDV
jgi:predicted ATPase with chaperone activity